MIINTKYDNNCIKCSKLITVGTKVEWEKGNGISHIKCPKIRNYSYKKLHTLKKCQNCKRDLKGDIYISDMNRLCEKCWEDTFELGGG